LPDSSSSDGLAVGDADVFVPVGERAGDADAFVAPGAVGATVGEAVGATAGEAVGATGGEAVGATVGESVHSLSSGPTALALLLMSSTAAVLHW
jgi:hypothetical protein